MLIIKHNASTRRQKLSARRTYVRTSLRERLLSQTPVPVLLYIFPSVYLVESLLSKKLTHKKQNEMDFDC